MTTAAATARVEVPCDPATAFSIFTADLGTWWKRGTRYWNDAARGQELRLEPGVSGRLLEIHDPETGAGFEIGRVLAWEPGKLLVFTWRQSDWAAAESTSVTVRFAAAGNGTRVSVEHDGWERVGSALPGLSEGYSQGWSELLGFYAQAAEAPPMFIHLAIHHPKPEYADDLLASMHRVDAAAQGAPGLIRIGAWKDQRSGRLVGLGLWVSPEAFQGSAEQIFAAVADDPFDQWCAEPPDVFYLTQ